MLSGRFYDKAKDDRIEINYTTFDGRHSFSNKFHGFLQEDLPKDLVKKIIQLAKT